MNESKNPSTVDFIKTPNPQVTRISRKITLLVIVLIVVLFFVALTSMPHNSTSTNKDVASVQSEAAATSEDQKWFQQKSNAVISKTNVSSKATGITDISEVISNDPKNNTKLQKMEQESYLQAINAPLTPPELQSQNIQSSYSNTEHNDNSNSSLDPNLRKLPLTQDQISRLSQAFGTGDATLDQNLQAEKSQFVENMTKKADKDYLDETLKKPVSPYELQAGSVIPAELNAGIDSDLPGQLTALVRQNVYDSVSGQYLLIPQGSKLIIIYDSNVAYGQERVLPAVKRIIFPNGQSMDLEGMPASDVSGYAGFYDQVNNHYARIYGSAIVMGGLSAAFQLSQPAQSNNNTNPTTTQIAAAAMGQQLAQVTTTTVSKNLNIQPTLTIRPGYKFNVNITADMVFPRPYTG